MKTISSSEKILFQRGRNEHGTFMQQEYLEPDEDLRRAVSSEELLAGIEADIREAFKKRHDA